MTDQPTQPSQPGQPNRPSWGELPSAPGQQHPGWGPPPPPPEGPGVRAASDPKPPFYRRGWFPLVTFLAGAIVGVGSVGGESEPQTRTVTQVSVQEIPTFKESCSDYTRVADIAACRGAQEKLEAAATTTTSKPTTTQPKPTPAPAPTFTDGLYKVSADIKPGSYRTSGGGGEDCYYARLKTDDTTSYIANNLSSGPMRMTVRSTDGYVEFSGGCEWRKA